MMKQSRIPHLLSAFSLAAAVLSFPLPPSMLAHALEAQMDLRIFHSILFTELSRELTLLNSTTVYYDSTREFWKKKKNNMSSILNPNVVAVRHSPRKRMQSYIVCSSVPNQSGYARKMELMQEIPQIFHNQTQGSKRIYWDDSAIYNGKDRSCFFVSLPFPRARRLAKKWQKCQQQQQDTLNSCDHFMIQPMLPMMKMSLGTVEKAVEISDEYPNNAVSILAQLSPFAKKKNNSTNHLDYSNVLYEIQTRSVESCQQQLVHALPYSGSIYTCPVWEDNDTNSLFWSNVKLEQQQQQEEDGIVRFTVDGKETSNVTTWTQGLLAMVTGLAAYNYFDMVEIMEQDYYSYYWS